MTALKHLEDVIRQYDDDIRVVEEQMQVLKKRHQEMKAGRAALSMVAQRVGSEEASKVPRISSSVRGTRKKPRKKLDRDVEGGSSQTARSQA